MMHRYIYCRWERHFFLKVASTTIAILLLLLGATKATSQVAISYPVYSWGTGLYLNGYWSSIEDYMTEHNQGSAAEWEACKARLAQNPNTNEICWNLQYSDPQPGIGPLDTEIRFINGLPKWVTFFLSGEEFSTQYGYTTSAGREGQAWLGMRTNCTVVGTTPRQTFLNPPTNTLIECVPQDRPITVNLPICKPDAGIMVGQPILPSSGEKYRRERDYVDGGPEPLEFARIYRSGLVSSNFSAAGHLSPGWTHSHAWSMSSQSSTAIGMLVINVPEGSSRIFTKNFTSNVWTPVVSGDSLEEVGQTYVWRDARTNTIRTFDKAKKHIIAQTDRAGRVTSYSYDATGKLASVINPFGRTLTFFYSNDRLTGVGTPSGQTIALSYDNSGRLMSVTLPDGKSKGYVYENANYPHHLTGLVDESGNRWATFQYDSQGRAQSTELAGGVSKYEATYASSGNTSIRDPLDNFRTYEFSYKNRQLAVVSASAIDGEGKPAIKTRVQNESGLVTSEVDYRGVRKEYTWDDIRRLPLSIKEAPDKAEERTTVIAWHATLAAPVSISEPGRVTQYTYDSAGRVQSMSLTDSLMSPANTRTWNWTYNPQGLVASEQSPNGSTTTYTYDARGNVLTETNAVGHVVVNTYDNSNRIVTRTDPNGLVTAYSWDPIGRLLTMTVGGTQTTSLTYTPYGALSTANLPSGLSFAYTYDAAHRLIGWNNNRGESATYTLDAMGNRTDEKIKNQGGSIALALAKYIRSDNNRIGNQTIGTGSDSYVLGYSYDENGELNYFNSPAVPRNSYSLDSLKRVKAVTDAVGSTASLTYDALGGVTQATDYKGVTTAYGRDAQGNATIESSADSGSRVASYDNLGLPQQIVDALGQATSITRDAIGRPTQFSYADGKTATLSWDTAFGGSNNGKGYLRRIQDATSTTTYTRDAFGRVTDKTIVLANGLTASIGYAYDAQGRLTTMLYPAGPAGNFPLVYAYDTTGRITGMTWRGWQLLSNITWNALGQPTGWTWAFSGFSGGSNQATTRSYDTAGRLTQVTVGSTPVLAMTYDAAGRIATYSQQVSRPATPSDPNSAVTSELITWNAGYNSVGRLTSLATASGTAAAAAASSSFGYDANGNRTSSSSTQGGTTTSRAYTLVANTNRPSGFSQTVGSTSTSVSYGYNANGDLTGDGLKGYRYDATGRMVSVAQGNTDTSAVTRYAHNALGQRIFKTEPLYPVQGTSGSALNAFFAKSWTPSTVSAEQVGWAYGYAEDGTLLGEYGMGGAQSTGNRIHVYLPTPSGPMPVIVMDDNSTWAVAVDHLNTPRRVTRTNGELEWQWTLSGFGEDAPTIAAKKFLPNAATSTADFSFNLRYPGQTQDKESGLHYNYFRTYDPRTGSYLQSDPIGLVGGWNRRAYALSNPLLFSDPSGLQVPMPPPPVPIPGVPNPVADANGDLSRRLTELANGGPDDQQKTYQTYTRYNPITGQCYSGRTSGYGTPEENIRDRARGQPLLNQEGYLPPVLDRSSTNYNAIRGREQQLIEINGGAQSSGGDSRNKINGISPLNLAGPLLYIPSANSEFGEPVSAGRCTCQ